MLRSRWFDDVVCLCQFVVTMLLGSGEVVAEKWLRTVSAVSSSGALSTASEGSTANASTLITAIDSGTDWISASRAILTHLSAPVVSSTIPGASLDCTGCCCTPTSGMVTPAAPNSAVGSVLNGDASTSVCVGEVAGGVTTSFMLTVTTNANPCGLTCVVVPGSRGVAPGGTVVPGLSSGGRSIEAVLRCRVPPTNALSGSSSSASACTHAIELKGSAWWSDAGGATPLLAGSVSAAPGSTEG